MKKKLLILTGMLIFFQFSFSLSCYFPSYNIENGKVSFSGPGNQNVISKADPETFKNIDGNFGIEKKCLLSW